MEAQTKLPNMHIGRKISRIRELRGIKQETLAFEIGVSQQTISRMEQSEVLEDEILEKVAKVLGVSSEAIKNYSDEAVIYNIQNNYDGSHNQGAQSNYGTFNFNPMDKLIQLVEENKNLYERLLQSEHEKNQLLKNQK